MPWPITSLQHCLLVICSLYHFSPGGSKKSANLPQQSYESLAQFIQAQQESRGLIRGRMLWIPARFFFPQRSWWWGHCQMKAGLSASISLAPASAFQGMGWPQLVAPVPLPSARLDAGGIHIQVHLALPAFDLFLGVTKFSKTKLEWRYFWRLGHSITETRDERIYWQPIFSPLRSCSFSELKFLKWGFCDVTGKLFLRSFLQEILFSLGCHCSVTTYCCSSPWW